MTGLERCLAALNGAPVDHCLAGMMLSLYGARLTGCPLDEYYRSSRHYVAGQVAVKERFDVDLLTSPFSLVAEAEAFGMEAQYYQDQPPSFRRSPYGSVDEFANTDIPDVDSHPRLTFIRESIRELHRMYGQALPIAAITVTPIGLPNLILGMELWLETLMFDKQRVPLVLDKTVPYFVKWSNALLADGATFLVVPVTFANPEMITMEILEASILPVLTTAFSQLKGPVIIHHTGNRLGPFLGVLRELPNVVGFVIDFKDSVCEARQGCGAEPVIMKGIPGPCLLSYDPHMLQRDCKYVLDEFSGDPHTAFMTTGADIPFYTPPENIELAISIVREHYHE